MTSAMRSRLWTGRFAVIVAAAIALIVLLPWSGADAVANIPPETPAVAHVSSDCTRTELTARRIGAHATRYSTTYLYWVTARRTCSDGSTETYYYQEWRNG